MEFRNTTLSNGLEVIAECNPAAYSTSLAFFVKTGSRDETDELAGVSHFLEHMVFKGTPRRTAEQVNRELDEIGADSNAYTSEEQTVYYASVLPEYQLRALDLLGDILRPSLRESDFETEKQVILEEIAKYDSQPPFGAHDRAMEAHFQDHPLGRSVLGTVETVGRLTADQMRQYFEQRYSPTNITLVAAGRVDFDQLVRRAEALCGSWQPFSVTRSTPRAVARQQVVEIVKESSAQQYLVEICNGPAAEDDDRYAGRMLATIFGDETGSRLFWEFVDPGLAEYAAVGAYEFQGTGVFMTFLCCGPDETPANVQRLREMQAQIQQHGVRERELDQAKSKVCSHLVLQSERSSNRLFSVGNNWIQRRTYSTVAENVAAYQRVSRGDLAAVLEKYPFTQQTVVCLGPQRGMPRHTSTSPQAR